MKKSILWEELRLWKENARVDRRKEEEGERGRKEKKG
jgi:hypothetical protein